MTHTHATVLLDWDRRRYPAASGAVLNMSDYLREKGDDPPPLRPEKTLVAVGALGVVHGDVETSPLYAFREASRLISPPGLRRLLDRLYALLHRMAANRSEYYQLPRGRVAKVGERVAV